MSLNYVHRLFKNELTRKHSPIVLEKNYNHD